MPTLLALPDARRTPITRGEGRLGRSDYLVNWRSAVAGSVLCQADAECSGDPGDCLKGGMVAEAVGEPAEAMQAAATSAVAPLASGAAAQIGSGRGRLTE